MKHLLVNAHNEYWWVVWTVECNYVVINKDPTVSHCAEWQDDGRLMMRRCCTPNETLIDTQTVNAQLMKGCTLERVYIFYLTHPLRCFQLRVLKKAFRHRYTVAKLINKHGSDSTKRRRVDTDSQLTTSCFPWLREFIISQNVQLVRLIFKTENIFIIWNSLIQSKFIIN